MEKERVLHWDGCKNVRDLGGLKTTDGRTTCWGAIIRSDTPARLTASGWSALYAYGVRTIITLCTHGLEEDELNFTPPYPDLAIVRIAIEDITDQEFVRQWVDTGFWCTPLYYRDALHRWPKQHAAVISAIARAQAGGVLFHCIRGYDRTGIIALLLLSLAGVTRDDIIMDYELSPDPERNDLLAREHSSVHEAIDCTLAQLDINRYLSAGGVSRDDVAIIRKKLLG